MTELLDRVRAAVATAYRVDRELGHGGMATVFLAEDLKHRRPVAIKVLDPDLAGVLGPERFLREIEVAARLQHPHILPLLDSGSGDGLLYYVMPFVEGQSLRARLDAERMLGQSEAVRLAAEIARALDHAHRRGMVHRDIKPENILLADGQAMVADFGIARAIGEAGGERLTRTGVTLGSPPYMSPEQIAGRRDVDARADLYALGCVLYEMLAGQPPFTGPPETLAHQHLNLTPRPVRELRTTISAAVDAAITRCLAKAPGDRFASAAEMAAALGEAASSTTASMSTGPEPVASPVTPGPAPAAAAARAGRPAGRSRRSRQTLIASLALMVIAAAGAFALWRSGVIGGPRPAAGESRRWVWLADFEGPASDPTLAPAARDLVGAAFDQSTMFAIVPTEQVRIALRNSGRPETTAVRPDVARELAFRSAIPVVVEGTIGRIGSRYTIVLRATNARDASVIQSVNGDAASDRELVPVLTRLARDVRKGLGERADAFRESASWVDAPTPSFEAFMLFQRGKDLINANDPQSSIPLFRHAIALDPEFASAWVGMGTAFGNMARDDSALAALEKALQFPARLTPERRLDTEGKIAAIRGDLQAQIGAYDAMLRLNPSPVWSALALNNKAVALTEHGFHAQALELNREAVKTYPIEAAPLSVGNVIDQLIALNRIEEARSELPRLKGPRAESLEFTFAVLDRKWERVDSLSQLRLSDPRTRLQPRRSAQLASVSVRAARGSIEQSVRKLDEMAVEARTEQDAGFGGLAWHVADWLDELRGAEPDEVPSWLRTTSWGSAGRAVLAARAGDSLAAVRALEDLPVAAKPKVRTLVEDHVAGRLEWKRGRWENAVARLRAHARGGIRYLPSVEEILRAPSRWLIADAFVQLGRPDSAVTYLHLLLAPPQNPGALLSTVGIWEPFARARLVKLYAGMGRLDEAQRQWEILSATCTRPDPDMVALLDETRATLQAARGMGTARR